jgi:plasmid stabilization system protein ParE
VTFVSWSEAAINDIEAHARYIAQFNPYAAGRIVRQVFAAGNSLSTFPKRGKARPDGSRELAVVHPYVLVYEIAADDIRILRVWHGAQDRD